MGPEMIQFLDEESLQPQVVDQTCHLLEKEVKRKKSK
jgi:hypothetical protein